MPLRFWLIRLVTALFVALLSATALAIPVEKHPSIGEAPPLDAAPEPVPIATAPPAAASEAVFEALVRSMLEPMLKAWLDANLPEIVERTTQAEIARLIGDD